MIDETSITVCRQPLDYAEWETGRGRVSPEEVEKAIQQLENAESPVRSVLVGHDAEGHAVRIDFGALPNSNVLFTGSSGMGKTSQIKSMLWQIALADGQRPVTFVIDYNDDFVTDFASALGERCVVLDLARDGLPFDILELPIDTLTGEPVTWEERIEMLANHFKGCLPTLGHVQLAYLKEGIRRLYRANRPFGDLPEVLADLNEQSPSSSIPNLLAQISHLFSLNLFPRRPICSLVGLLSGELAEVVVCRVKIASRPIQTLVGTFLIQNLFHFCQLRGQKHGSTTGRDLVLVLDEFHRFQGVSSLEQTLVTLLREGRKFRVSTWAATQTYTDVAEPVMTNTDTKFYFGTSASVAGKVAAALPSDEAPESKVKREVLEMKVGQALVANSELRPYQSLRTLLFHELTGDEEDSGTPRMLERPLPDEIEDGLCEKETAPSPVIRALTRRVEEKGADEEEVQGIHLPERYLNFKVTPARARDDSGGATFEPVIYPFMVFEHKGAGWFSRSSVWDGTDGRLLRELSPLKFAWGIFPKVLELSRVAQQRLASLLQPESEDDPPGESEADSELAALGLAPSLGAKAELVSLKPRGVAEIPDGLCLAAREVPWNGRLVDKIGNVLEVVYGREVISAYLLWYPVLKPGSGPCLSGLRKRTVLDLYV